METVSLRKSSQIDVNQRYDEILLMLADAKKRGENFIKVEYLHYELYMKLIEHNYVIQKNETACVFLSVFEENN